MILREQLGSQQFTLCLYGPPNVRIFIKRKPVTSKSKPRRYPRIKSPTHILRPLFGSLIVMLSLIVCLGLSIYPIWPARDVVPLSCRYVLFFPSTLTSPNPTSMKSKRQNPPTLMAVSLNKGTQYRPQNTVVLNYGNPQKATPNFENPPYSFGF